LEAEAIFAKNKSLSFVPSGLSTVGMFMHERAQEKLCTQVGTHTYLGEEGDASDAAGGGTDPEELAGEWVPP
jgi:hypothetical protein